MLSPHLTSGRIKLEQNRCSVVVHDLSATWRLIDLLRIFANIASIRFLDTALLSDNAPHSTFKNSQSSFYTTSSGGLAINVGGKQPGIKHASRHASLGENRFLVPDSYWHDAVAQL